jgi:hypothetical protein
VEVFPDFLVWAGAAGLVLSIIELVWHRRVLPLLLGLAGMPLGGVAGRVAFEWFADEEFGSGFLTGYDWVMVYASMGVLVGALVGIVISARRERRAALP